MLISFCYKLGITYSEKSVLVLNHILVVFSDMRDSGACMSVRG